MSLLTGALAVATGPVLAVLTGAEDGLRPDLEPTDVTPGVVGFAVTALVVVGLIGLLLSMVVKLRKVNLGAEPAERPWAAPTGPDAEGGVDGGAAPGRPGPGGASRPEDPDGADPGR